MQNNCPVAVYTMAKVASISIYHSIKMKTDMPVFHVHTFDIEKIKHSELLCKEKGVVPASRQVGHLIYKHRILPEKPLNIISTVRDPISRNISAFFEAFFYHVNKTTESWNGTMEELMNEYFIKKMNHNYPLEWFENEFKLMTGFDVYKHPFDKDEKYIRLKFKNINILIFRVDVPDHSKSEIIADFLGVSEFELINKNIGSKKKYSTLYQKFINETRLPTSYVEEMLDSQFARHFYSYTEREMLFKKYS